MLTGAEADKVLTTDASGIASWKTPAGGEAIPAGVIVMWSGTLTTIPSGWHLCDGISGTPDLRDRFVLGSSASENPGATGGTNSYSLTEAQLPSHKHTASASTAGAHTHTIQHYTCNLTHTGDYYLENMCTIGSATQYTTGASGAHTHYISIGSTGSGTQIENRPSYYKLAYIMKL